MCNTPTLAILLSRYSLSQHAYGCSSEPGIAGRRHACSTNEYKNKNSDQQPWLQITSRAMPATYYKYEKAATMAANRIMDLACNNKYEKAATMAANIIMAHFKN